MKHLILSLTILVSAPAWATCADDLIAEHRLNLIKSAYSEGGNHESRITNYVGVSWQTIEDLAKNGKVRINLDQLVSANDELRAQENAHEISLIRHIERRIETRKLRLQRDSRENILKLLRAAEDAGLTKAKLDYFSLSQDFVRQHWPTFKQMASVQRARSVKWDDVLTGIFSALPRKTGVVLGLQLIKSEDGSLPEEIHLRNVVLIEPLGQFEFDRLQIMLKPIVRD